MTVDVLVEPVRIRATIRLERGGRAALEYVEAVNVVRFPDVDTRTHVSVVRPGHVAEERVGAVEGEGDVVVVALERYRAVPEHLVRGLVRCGRDNAEWCEPCSVVRDRGVRADDVG